DDRRSWGILSGRFLRSRVDPHRRRQIGRLRTALDEPFGMRRVGRVEDLTPLVAHTSGLIEMHDGGRQKPKAAVAMLLVVPAEEDLPKCTAILNRSKTLRKLRTILQRFELRFGKRIVVGDMRTAMRFGDPEIR